MCGLVAFLGLVAAFSKNLRAVNPRTLVAGIALQFALAVAVIHSPDVRAAFEVVGGGVKKLLDYSARGGEFVFGNLARPRDQADVYEDKFLFPFAWVALPPIIFVSGFFSVLYYFGVLQLVVRAMAWVMARVMGTSGAETLSVSANVFMGQTEAPLIVKPFVPRMTESELLALMASGMAHVSGGMMAVYIGYATGYFGGDGGAAAVAILTTCVMACPCSLYLSKLLLPETGTPETLGTVRVSVEQKHVNPIDALAAGISDGLRLALNVAAMLIGFLAMIALLNGLLGLIRPDLTLEYLLGWVFRPAAFLIGVPPEECGKVGGLLGIKLVANEHVAFLELTKNPQYADLSLRAKVLTVYALTGFANFSSVGIQLGGIGALAEGRRADLARLGMRALFVGFTATLVNAAVAGILL
jgi:CNT family concentrative nucleoside transporter